MRIFSNYWLKQLVLILFLFSYSLNSYAFLSKYWSSVAMRFHPDKLEENNKKDDAISTNCRLTGAKETDGYPDLPRQYSKVTFAWNSMIIDYGKDIKEFAGFKGQWVYAERFPFSDKLNSAQSQKIQSLIKKALIDDKCDIAQALSDSLQNPHVTDDYVGVQNGDDKCVILKDGSSRCNWSGPAEQCDENGQNCHITIGNDKQGSFDDYINSKEKPKENVNEPESPPSNSNNPKDSNNSSGSGSSGSGSGNSNGSSSSGSQSNGSNNGSQGNNQGGSNVGSGSGNGEGDNEGDGDSDLDKPSLQDFDLESAFSSLKESLKDYIPDLSMPGGSCPEFTIPVFSTTVNIDVHCQIFDANGQKITAVFNLIWGFIAIRILLSA